MIGKQGLRTIDAMTLFGVTRRKAAPEAAEIVTAGSLRMETFEGSRSRFGQTRTIIGISIDIPLEVMNYEALL